MEFIQISANLPVNANMGGRSLGTNGYIERERISLDSPIIDFERCLCILEPLNSSISIPADVNTAENAFVFVYIVRVRAMSALATAECAKRYDVYASGWLRHWLTM